MKPQHYILLTFLSTFLTFCNTQIKEDEVKLSSADSLPKDITLKIPTIPSRINKPLPPSDVNTLISLLDNNLPLESKYTGLAGEESLTYANYESLKRNASDSILLKLTYHPNPKIRVYAMWALKDNNEELAIKQLPRLCKDNKIIDFESGCMTMPESVNYLIASQFDTSIVSIRSKYINGNLKYEIIPK